MKNDVLIGRILRIRDRNTQTTKIKDCSVSAKNSDVGVVDSVYEGTTPEGFKIVKVKIRRHRIPLVGDKVASRSAQKGTIGAMYSAEDMPFTADGLTPDIIINPHCIPSRMTINQLIESLSSALSLVTGERIDATAFGEGSTNAVPDIREQLRKLGMNTDGTKTLFCGHTGEKIEAAIYMGSTFYQKLKHMVADKMHARAHGDLQVLTRQPLEGRARDGGMRAGEMERDNLLTHGAGGFLHEKLLDLSDYYEMDVCRSCRRFSNPKECRFCGSDDITRVQAPYACKLLFHELQAMNIRIDVGTS